MLKSNIPDYDKLDQLLDWDEVLGLGLAAVGEEKIPEEVKSLGVTRETLRKQGKFVVADEVRLELEKMGWAVEDTPIGGKFRKLIVHS